MGLHSANPFTAPSSRKHLIRSASDHLLLLNQFATLICKTPGLHWNISKILRYIPFTHSGWKKIELNNDWISIIEIGRMFDHFQIGSISYFASIPKITIKMTSISKNNQSGNKYSPIYCALHATLSTWAFIRLGMMTSASIRRRVRSSGSPEDEKIRGWRGRIVDSALAYCFFDKTTLIVWTEITNSYKNRSTKTEHRTNRVQRVQKRSNGAWWSSWHDRPFLS